MDRRSFVTFTILFVIFILSLGVRFFRVGESPASLNWDEASLGYNAYSILKTGKDEYSRMLPVSLRSFDDYKPALYAYFTIPGMFIDKPTDVTTRIPSIVFGSLLPFSLFVIVFLTTKSRLAALISAATAAFEPWSMHFSRVAFESNVAVSLLFIAVALFIRSLVNFKYYYLSLIFFVLSMYAYHSERAIALPLLFVLTILFWEQLGSRVRRGWINLLGLLIILLLPLALNLMADPITSRLSYTNIFKLWPFIPKEFSWVIYNPIFTLIWHIAGQWLAYFSPHTLFVTGSIEPGQYTPSLGLLHLVELPLWIFGFFVLKNYRKLLKILLPILILAPFPAIITWNWFSAVRTLPVYAAFAVVVAIGLVHVKKYLLPIFVGLWIISVGYLINTEILYSPIVTYGEYQPGFEKAIPLLLAESRNYDHVVIDSPHIAPYIFLLFYGQYDPGLYQSQAPRRIKNSGTESIPFHKFEFREIDWENDKHLPHTLFMGPTPRLPDYEFEHTPYAKILTDVYDIKGYISLRIVATK
jgi:4-amino-4-deoxy-L-arabinose transferase-like glycosyltransferase